MLVLKLFSDFRYFTIFFQSIDWFASYAFFEKFCVLSEEVNDVEIG